MVWQCRATDADKATSHPMYLNTLKVSVSYESVIGSAAVEYGQVCLVHVAHLSWQTCTACLPLPISCHNGMSLHI